jgi:phenylacetate-coenzyme A ligase PaaK-like adenylate-forming protein
MNRIFMPAFKTKEELAAIQLAGLKWTVRHAFEGSPFYRQRLTEAGVTPDRIQSLDDLKRLPFLTAQDLRENYPWALLSVPMTRIVRLHASTGTTGKRKVLVYTAKEKGGQLPIFT